MDENINKHLHDILDAINEIESFFGNKPKYFNEFCNQDSEREQEHSHYQFPKDSGCKELYHTWL